MRPSLASRAALLAILVTLGAAVVTPSPVRAQAAAGTEALQVERVRLRAQLATVNAEIDGLKRAGGGVRDDYRLRARLADAESLARRLMDIEARLGVRVDGAAKLQPPPTAAPTDGPADLDAKADILADQSRRVRAQADALGRRAADARHRQELRKRAADLDRDPFAPMEGSKRRVASGSGAAVVAVPAASPARPIAGSGPLMPVSGAGSQSTGDLVGQPAAPLSTQLRGLLDTTSLTDVRRLEASGGGATSPQALERAATALRARADWLDAQSHAMRARARAK
jgi:hypothetical protein